MRIISETVKSSRHCLVASYVEDIDVIEYNIIIRNDLLNKAFDMTSKKILDSSLLFIIIISCYPGIERVRIAAI